MRTAGTDVSWTYLSNVSVPHSGIVNAHPTRIQTQLAWTHQVRRITDRCDLWPLLWEANRAVAEAYDLTSDDFEHILHSFPVFARKRKEFFAYLLQRLAEWKAEGRRGPAYEPTDEPLPAAAEAPETWEDEGRRGNEQGRTRR
jgi:hypothetical protein